jgi:CheY-like chemotaxis protein
VTDTERSIASCLGPAKGKRLLLVEDEPLIRLWLAECLSEAGFDVVEAEDGDQAILLLEQPQAFDLLITDIQMPGRADGNAVATWATERYPRLPVIYVSGRPESLKNEVRYCDAFISKPYTSATMLNTAQAILDAHHGRDSIVIERQPRSSGDHANGRAA